MKVSGKTYFASIILAVLLTFSATYTYNYALQHRSPKARVNVYVFHESARGVDLIGSGNLITNDGERYVRNILGFDNVTANNATKWISLSNDASPSATWTELPTELDNTNGFGRALGDVVAWINSDDFAYNVTKKFTATGSVTAQCAGLQWNDVAQTANNLFAAAAFTQTTFANNDNVTIIWVITIDANN